MLVRFLNASSVLWLVSVSVSVAILMMPAGAAAQDRSTIEIVPQTWHPQPAMSAMFTRDGAFVLSLGMDGVAKLWSAESGILLRNFSGGDAPFHPAALSPDGRHLVMGLWDARSLRLWETATGKILKTAPLPGALSQVLSVAYSSDGRHLASGSFDGTIRMWNAATGAIMQTIKGHSSQVWSVSFSPDGKWFVSGGGDKVAKLWDRATGKPVRTLVGDSRQVNAVGFSPDSKLVLTGGSDGTLQLWSVADGMLVRTLTDPTPAAKQREKQIDESKLRGISAVAFCQRGAIMASAYLHGKINIWSVADGSLRRTLDSGNGAHTFSFSPDCTSIVFQTFAGVQIWDVGTGKLSRSLVGTSVLGHPSLSSSGLHAWSMTADYRSVLWDLSAGRVVRIFDEKGSGEVLLPSGDGSILIEGKIAKLVDQASGKVIRTFEGHSVEGSAFSGFTSVSVSSDGQWMATGGYDKVAHLWEISTGRLVRTFDGHEQGERFFDSPKVALSPDAKRVLLSLSKSSRLYDAANGRLLRSIEKQLDTGGAVAFSPDGKQLLTVDGDHTAKVYSIKIWDESGGRLLRTLGEHKGQIWRTDFSSDGSRVLSGSSDNTAKLWDAKKGSLLQTFEHAAAVHSVAFSAKGDRIFTGGKDGMLGIWDAATGQRLTSLATGRQGDWLAMTSQGFLSGSRRDPEMLAIVRGMEATAIGQVHQSLFNPDLVRETLAGDPEGEVRASAAATDLSKVLASGPAPSVAIVSPVETIEAKDDVATLSARIADQGKGIGRIEWRVNGITAAVAAKPENAAREFTVTQQLALDPGENVIEVVAYNASNLLASLPARSTIKLTGTVDQRKPRLHVLAIGIDSYRSNVFSRLNFAVKDAKAFGAAMQQAAVDLYAEARVAYALDEAARTAALDALIERLGRDVHPRDTFILFASAHGYSRNGRFYLIPQDYADGLEAMEGRAIGQDKLQEWIANRIKARKVLILLDTCESGALVGGHTASRLNAPATEAAIGRLHEATGRPILTAAASGRAAFEGYKQHGVFTYALLDAFKNADQNGNGTIELSELVAHVQAQVARIGVELNAPTRGFVAMSAKTLSRQSARFGSRGEDFPVVRRLP